MYITALPKIPPLGRPIQRELPQPVRQPIRRIAQLVRNRLLVRVRDREVGHVLVGDVGDVRVGGLGGLLRGFFEAAGVFGEAEGGFLEGDEVDGLEEGVRVVEDARYEGFGVAQARVGVRVLYNETGLSKLPGWVMGERTSRKSLVSSTDMPKVRSTSRRRSGVGSAASALITKDEWHDAGKG